MVEVCDFGICVCGYLLKGDWFIFVLFKLLVLNGILRGVVNVIVEKERVEFNNLFVFFYGIGYKLIFEFN